MRFIIFICFIPLMLAAQTPASRLVKTIQMTHGKQSANLVEILKSNPYIGQGNPAITKHPVTREQCLQQAEKTGHSYLNPEFLNICGNKYMAPLYDPLKEDAQDAKVCIDQFEFPNIPCEYPVVWVRANEAAAICELQGKRLCDAHEWEGACEGRLAKPDYLFELGQGQSISEKVSIRRKKHNSSVRKTWAYGSVRRLGICSSNSFKSKECSGGDWEKCGSNTYPAGYSRECKSRLEVYDQHGNAAEHMNLPMVGNEISTQTKTSSGVTEMKGSWFIFDKYKAHSDYCRWRAPYWHGSRVKSQNSHRNYHLGFRCCKDLNPRPVKHKK